MDLSNTLNVDISVRINRGFIFAFLILLPIYGIIEVIFVILIFHKYFGHKHFRIVQISFTGAVKKNPMTAKNTKHEVEKAVGAWLLGHRDRDGNRLKRARLEEEKRKNKENAA